MKEESKKIIFILIVIALIILIALLGLKLTGYAVSGDETGVSVTRIINQSENTTEVQLGIVSSENVLAIEEQFIGENCTDDLTYYLDSDIDIFEFNKNSVIWVLANRSDNLIVNLFYSISSDCEVNQSAGRVYTLSGEELSEGGFDNEDEDDSVVPPADGGTGGTSGGGGGDGGGGGGGARIVNASSNIQSSPIVQADNKEEFDNMFTSALDKLAGKENPSQTVDRPSFILYLALIGTAVIIVIFFVVSFLRRPKSSDERK
ncbi:MAG: hypothetical protein KKB21_00450 [Nanoarchaeota archaeon]|nr:hypothetical protein [Nanoarchaeota archaeon]MBU4086025.1 hypothetical protein [Nanoarchaeota archaeon]